MGWNPDAYGRLPSGQEILRFFGALKDESQGPGPECSGELLRILRDIFRKRKSVFCRCEVNDHGVVGGTALHCIEARNGFGIGRIRAEAIDRFGGKGDEAAGAQDLRGAADLGGHSLSGAASSTAFVCLRRNSSSFLESSLSLRERTAAAKSAAFAAPASPIANVATGMPFGICTVERSESRPCRCLEGIGTPSTGSVVCAATTPARCAAPPAAAIRHFIPRCGALSVHSATACGVRCADIAFAS